MSAAPRVWVVIPAAGIGSRFSGTGEPKQYARVGSLTLLEHGARVLLQLDPLQQLVIALHPADQQAKRLPLLQHEKIRFVQGGNERSDSVLQGLLALCDAAAPDDWVLVHDAARPCLLATDLAKLVDALSDDPVGGILAVPVIDTLKKVANHTILQTIDRSEVWQAQTPQMFRYGLLLQSLQQAREMQLPVTDEASALELAGYKVRVVEGSRSNIKVTYPDDLALAGFFLQQEQRI